MSQAGSGFNPQAGQNKFNTNPGTWYARKNSGSVRSAECAAFISESYIFHKNPTQPAVTCEQNGLRTRPDFLGGQPRSFHLSAKHRQIQPSKSLFLLHTQ
jgi:hypothetical protein